MKWPMKSYMMNQEVEHLETFDSLLNERQVRPSLLDPLWGAAGLTLGIVTAAMGPKAAMACTIAVEEVIGEHFQKRANILGKDESDLQAIVERVRDEELEHRDIAVDHNGHEAQHYDLLRRVIQRGCRTAIKISEKV